MDSLVKKIWKIAEENAEGFTVFIPNCEFVKAGWCIAHRDTQDSFGKEGLQKVIEHALQTTKIVGGWKGRNGNFYFDTVIIVFDEKEAFDLKKAHNQIEIFQLETGKSF